MTGPPPTRKAGSRDSGSSWRRCFTPGRWRCARHRAAGGAPAAGYLGGARSGAAPTQRSLLGSARSPGAGGGGVHRPGPAHRRLLRRGELRPGGGSARLWPLRRRAADLVRSVRSSAAYTRGGSCDRRERAAAVRRRRASLPKALEQVTDPGARRGIPYSIASILAIVVTAGVVTAGLSGCARSFRSAGDFAADLPQEARPAWRPVLPRQASLHRPERGDHPPPRADDRR